MAVSNIDKIVAKEEARVFGGNPTVEEYFDEAEKKKIAIFQSLNVPDEGLQTCATVGLHEVGIGMVSMGKKLRVEVAGAIDLRVEQYPNIMSTIAFNIMDAKRCHPGFILDDVIPLYIPDTDMKHILLTYPYIWADADDIDNSILQGITVEDRLITVLMAIPISERESAYADKYGFDALEDVFEKEQIDYYDIYRESVL